MTPTERRDRQIILTHNRRVLAEMRDALERLQPGEEYGLSDYDFSRLSQWVAYMLEKVNHQLTLAVCEELEENEVESSPA